MADEKAPDLRGGGIGRRDRWFGMENLADFEEFRRWWHRVGKRDLGRNLNNREEALDAYKDFQSGQRPMTDP